MKHPKKLTTFSILILFSLILSLVFPINVLADDATPPPVETPEVVPRQNPQQPKHRLSLKNQIAEPVLTVPASLKYQ
jgi:hypothetical protein